MSDEVRRSNRTRRQPQTLYPAASPSPPRRAKRKQPPSTTTSSGAARSKKPTTSTSTTQSRTTSDLTVRSPEFWDAVTAPCKVEKVEGDTEEPEDHFEIDEEERAPLKGPASFYSKFKGLNVNIFNDTTDEYCEMVANEYKALISYKDSNEAELQRSSYYLFKFEARNPGMAKDYIFHTEATPQESVKPDPKEFWSTPPSFPPDSAQYFEYNIFPDLLYWISLNGFPQDYQGDACQHVHIRGKRKLCPYLAIEYKVSTTNEDKRVSMSQLTSAMLLCLWNRFDLRKRALAAEGKDWKQDENRDIRVYSVRILADDYTVWTMTPVIDSKGEWEGAELKRLLKQDLMSVRGVRGLAIWINEIHRWALTIHAQQVKEDLRAFASGGGAPPEQRFLFDDTS